MSMQILISPSAMSVAPIQPWELKSAYQQGRNIMQMLRQDSQSCVNDERTIELSYDLQSGSYIRSAESVEGGATLRQYSRHLADVLSGLGPIDSLLEAGVGEATTLWNVIDQLAKTPTHVHGFDLCWSRVASGARWLAKQATRYDIRLATASLLELPYQDNSFDVVYTAHAIEPNRGREEAILKELHRVASRYLVLLEPAYELASAEARARMDAHGYCTGLAETARALGFKVERHEIFSGTYAHTPLNPTGLLLISKDPAAPAVAPSYACPSYRTPMRRMADCFYSEQSMQAYPIIAGIPCLRSGAGIVASKLGELASDEN
jgi:SAM-dependent methyltransferase